MGKVKIGFVLILLIICGSVLSQGKDTSKRISDSLKNRDSRVDSLKETEQEILKQQEQNKQDSIIKAGIQEKMAEYSEDSQKKAELEQKLREIESADSIKKAAQLLKIQKLKEKARGFPVVLMRDTLMEIYTKLGSFEPHDRAATINNRLKQLYDNDFFYPDSLRIDKSETTDDIFYSGIILMSVTDMDALWLNKTRDELSKEYVNKIKDAVVKVREDNSFVNRLKRFGLALLTLIGLYVLVKGIFVLFNRITEYIIARKDKYLTGISIKDFKLLNQEQSMKVVQIALKFLRFFVILLALYLSLPVLFSIFPVTKSYAGILIGWVINPAKLILNTTLNYLPNLFTIIIIFVFTRYAIKAVKYFANEIAEGRLSLGTFHKDWAMPTFQIIKFIMYALMFVVIFPYLPGSSSPAFQGVSVFLGILVSFGSSSSIANIMAGLVITYMRPFKIGDRIMIGDVTGDVIEKTLLVTRLRTIKNEDITVPNSLVLSGHTTNYSTNSKDTGLIVHTTVTIGYDVPWKKMHEVLIESAGRTDLLLKDPKPFVLQTSLDDFYVSYQINAYTHDANKQAKIYSDLHQNIQDVCNENQIEIMSPHYKALRDGNLVTIPAEYLPKDYKIPPFNIKEEKGL
ncbi:MAG: mechanosensitive ion channel [Bacteroidetes bacterium]|nr:mechanosensitive ion channel [Bacteroidota bacterium]